MRRAGTTRRPRWTQLVLRLGWRAYAVAVLAVVTVAVLAQGATRSISAADDNLTAASQHAVVDEGKPVHPAAFAPAATPKPVTIQLAAETTSCAQNSYDRLVIVSIDQQHLWACRGHRQIDSTPVTTGRTAHHDQTPLGTWRVQGKQRDRYLVGPGYKDYVHYWVPFNGDFGFHDAPWQTMAFGSQDYPQQGSHGCVHLPRTQMAWLYHWMTVGSTVVSIQR